MKKLFLSLLLASVSVLAEDVSSYLYGEYKSVDNVKSTLSASGLDIIGEYDAMDDKQYHVVVYTNSAIKKLASKESRGFAGVQKVLIDSKENTLVFTNPDYFMAAFLQDDNDAKVAKNITAKLSTSFGKLSGSSCKLEDDDISGYHFMMSMPYYEDMIEIASGEGLESILEANAKENIVFKLKLDNATLYGVAMHTDDGENSYIPAIEANKHSAFLPYMVLIEDNKAKILHGKFYLAIANPDLSMGDFMNISSAPGDIEDYMTKLVTK